MKTVLSLFLSLAALVSVGLISLLAGENVLTLSQLLGVDTLADDSVERIILYEIRLPRMLMAAACGALLSISGVIMQGLFRNPLVEPYTMGLSGGALLGVGMATILGMVESFGSWTVTLMAMVGALVSMAVVLIFRHMTHSGQYAMLLVGVMISFATSSANMLLMSLATRDNLSQIVGWSMGTFDAVVPTGAAVMAVVAVVVAVVSPLAGNVLNILSLGEDVAGHLGVNVRLVVSVLFVVATMLAAACVSEVGLVAFVGLVVPHVVRRLVGSDHRLLLPLSGVVGAAYMIFCDVLARQVLYPRELPAGVFSGIIGGFLFIFLVMRRKHHVEA